MKIPLVVLAAVSCVAGFIPFGHFVTWNRMPYDIHLDPWIACSSVAIAICSILLAARMYRSKNPIPEKMKNAMPTLWDWCHHRFYWDELYLFITHKIIFNGICRPLAWFDRHIIDGTMDSFATVTNKLSRVIAPMQSGQVQMYVFIYIIGALLLGGITVLCLI